MNESLMKRVENTPFTIVQRGEKEEYIIVMGNMIASQRVFGTPAEAEIYVCEKPWELIFNLCIIINEQSENIRLQQKEIDEGILHEQEVVEELLNEGTA